MVRCCCRQQHGEEAASSAVVSESGQVSRRNSSEMRKRRESQAEGTAGAKECRHFLVCGMFWEQRNPIESSMVPMSQRDGQQEW